MFGPCYEGSFKSECLKSKNILTEGDRSIMAMKCLFKFRYGPECDNSKPCSSNKGHARIDSIIKASKVYRDDLHVELEQKVEEDETLTVYFHRNCVSRYTSSSNMVRHTRDRSVNDHQAKKLRRSHTSFDFFLSVPVLWRAM